MDRHHATSAETRTAIKADLAGRPVVLAFSAGKDSIAAWLALRDLGLEVRPVYKFLVPGLAFVERSLAYYERHFGVPIARAPHPSLFRWLRNLTFQAPEHCRILEEFDPLEPTQADGSEIAARRVGLKLSETWIATGVRGADSPLRRIALKKHGAINPTLRQFWAVWDWTKADVLDAIRREGVKLPADYRIWGRSFDGLDARFLVPLAKHYPDDYKRVLEWFPLAELEVRRHGWQEERAAAARG